MSIEKMQETLPKVGDGKRLKRLIKTVRDNKVRVKRVHSGCRKCYQGIERNVKGFWRRIRDLGSYADNEIVEPSLAWRQKHRQIVAEVLRILLSWAFRLYYTFL
jgi:hypothetical protein